MTEYSPVTIIGDDRPADWVVICDHATNIVPDFVANGDLGLPAEQAASIPTPLAKLACKETEDWIARYRADPLVSPV